MTKNSQQAPSYGGQSGPPQLSTGRPMQFGSVGPTQNFGASPQAGNQQMQGSPAFQAEAARRQQVFNQMQQSGQIAPPSGRGEQIVSMGNMLRNRPANPGLNRAINTPGTGANRRLKELMDMQAQQQTPNIGGSDQQITMPYNLPPRQQPTPQPGPPTGQPAPQPGPQPSAPPAQPGPQPAAQPTNRQMIDSLRGLSKGDERWFNQLFSENQGLAGRSNWANEDADQLRQSIRTGGLNPQNQQRLTSALRMGRPGFAEPPPLQQGPPTGMMNQGIRYASGR